MVVLREEGPNHVTRRHSQIFSLSVSVRPAFFGRGRESLTEMERERKIERKKDPSLSRDRPAGRPTNGQERGGKIDFRTRNETKERPIWERERKERKGYFAFIHSCVALFSTGHAHETPKRRAIDISLSTSALLCTAWALYRTV